MRKSPGNYQRSRQEPPQLFPRSGSTVPVNDAPKEINLVGWTLLLCAATEDYVCPRF